MNIFYVEEVKPGVKAVRLNHADNGNQLDVMFLASIEDAIAEVTRDKSVRCVIVASDVAHVFSLGLDLSEREGLKDRQLGPFIARIRSLIAQIREIRVPTICAINGYREYRKSRSYSS